MSVGELILGKEGIGLQCSSTPANFAFSAILLSGPTDEITPEAESLFSFYDPDPGDFVDRSGGADWQVHNRSLIMHVGFVTQVIEQVLEPLMEPRGTSISAARYVCALVQVFELAVARVVHMQPKRTAVKCTASPWFAYVHAKSFFHRFLGYFNRYMSQVLRFKPSFGQRGSVLLRSMRSLRAPW